MPVLSKIHPIKCCDFANRQRFPVCFSQFSVIFPEFQRNNTPEGDHRTMSPSRTTSGRERTQATPTTTMCSWLLVPPYTFRVVPRTLSKSTVRTGRTASLERCTICRSPISLSMAAPGWPCSPSGRMDPATSARTARSSAGVRGSRGWRN